MHPLLSYIIPVRPVPRRHKEGVRKYSRCSQLHPLYCVPYQALRYIGLIGQVLSRVILYMGFTAAERQQVWLRCCGRRFESTCAIAWCDNTMNVFQFHVGHNRPKSTGGQNTLENLVPICANCNMSMGNRYTIDEWNALHKPPPNTKKTTFCCFRL